MSLPDAGTTDAFACPFCGAHHLMSQFVAPQMLAAQRVRDGFREVFAVAQAKQRRANLLILGIVAIVVVLVLFGILLTRVV